MYDFNVSNNNPSNKAFVSLDSFLRIHLFPKICPARRSRHLEICISRGAFAKNTFTMEIYQTEFQREVYKAVQLIQSAYCAIFHEFSDIIQTGKYEK